MGCRLILALDPKLPAPSTACVQRVQVSTQPTRVELAAELLVRRADPDLSGYTFQLVVVAPAAVAASHKFLLTISIVLLLFDLRREDGESIRVKWARRCIIH